MKKKIYRDTLYTAKKGIQDQSLINRGQGNTEEQTQMVLIKRMTKSDKVLYMTMQLHCSPESRETRVVMTEQHQKMTKSAETAAECVRWLDGVVRVGSRAVFVSSMPTVCPLHMSPVCVLCVTTISSAVHSGQW